MRMYALNQTAGRRDFAAAFTILLTVTLLAGAASAETLKTFSKGCIFHVLFDADFWVNLLTAKVTVITFHLTVNQSNVSQVSIYLMSLKRHNFNKVVNLTTIWAIKLVAKIKSYFSVLFSHKCSSIYFTASVALGNGAGVGVAIGKSLLSPMPPPSLTT